ncbi:MAG: hypothetical protein JF592_04250 [Microbacterium sp.]|uniref:hypothetical protein n=1 Tax=Microbacterium sp. TaxID=51671 RepID=UPI001D874B90|nr:hypothetical protein [Microbacterium sp.]MBW8761784.1 hypothetical protein [Microbacterium sp.]
MGESATAGRSWRTLRFAAIQLASAGAGMVAWMVLPRVASGVEQEPAIIAFALGPILALPLTLGVPAMLPNAFRRSADGGYLRPGSWSGPLRVVCWLVGFATALGILLLIIDGFVDARLETAALTASYAAGMGTWLVAAQVSRIKESTILMMAGGLLNPALPLAWMLFTGSGLSRDLAASASVMVMSAMCVGLWLGMGSLLRAGASSPGGDVRRALLLAMVLVPHLALFAVLMQGIRLSAIVVGAPEVLEQAHLASLGVTMVSVLVNSIHSLLSVRIQTSDDPALMASIRMTSTGYGALVLASTVMTLIFYLVLPFVSGVGVSFSVAVPLGLTVPALVVYYASSAIQLRTGSATRLLTASGGAVALWVFATVLIPADSLLGLAWVFAIAPVSMAIIVAVLGSFNPEPLTRSATRLMIRRIAPTVGACVVALVAAGAAAAFVGG